MSRSTRRRVGFAALGAGLIAGLVALLVVSGGVLQAQRGAVPAEGYLTGVVQGPKGPEAGVWVIAETKDLPTNFIKIVVTDDQGRFMVPELPTASYSVWVRGYGLVDSEARADEADRDSDDAARARGEHAAGSGQGLSRRLLAVDARAADDEGVPRHRQPPQGNGIGAGMQTQDHWINSLKSDCNFCHQLGNRITRIARSRLQGEAGTEDARRGVGMAARRRRARHQHVRRARPRRGRRAR